MRTLIKTVSALNIICSLPVSLLLSAIFLFSIFIGSYISSQQSLPLDFIFLSVVQAAILIWLVFLTAISIIQSGKNCDNCWDTKFTLITINLVICCFIDLYIVLSYLT